MKYIYLIITPEGFLYVGSHEWNGIGLDPNYKGSGSRVISRSDYKELKCMILEDCSHMSDLEFDARETEWIRAFASCFGVRPFSTNGVSYLEEFYKSYCRPDGKVINCCLSRRKGFNEKDLEKALKSKILKGNGDPLWYVHTDEHYNLIKETHNGDLMWQCHTPEARKVATCKSVSTKRERGQYDNMEWNSQDIQKKALDTKTNNGNGDPMYMCHTKDAHNRSVTTRKLNGSYSDAANHLNSDSKNAAKVSVGRTRKFHPELTDLDQLFQFCSNLHPEYVEYYKEIIYGQI